ncbi:MAG TPA: hypothetical protein VFO79_02280 [Xanthomonadales bacterium]|nr:hypothetical protein [Xanthomonadales bacterium]
METRARYPGRAAILGAAVAVAAIASTQSRAQVFEAIAQPRYGPLELGTQADNYAAMGGFSGNGRYVFFGSLAGNLVPGSGTYFFAHDRNAATISRVGNCLPIVGPSNRLVASADGQVVAFVSGAGCIATGTTDFGRRDVFVYDRTTDTLTRASVGLAGAQPNEDSGEPAISGDGRYVAFSSAASNLVAGDTNFEVDVFVFDRTTATLTRASVDPAGPQANGSSSRPSLSGDGRWLAFVSGATNLYASDTNFRNDVFLLDRNANALRRVREGEEVAVSSDGTHLAFSSSAAILPGDTNNAVDIFVYEVATLATSRVSFGAGFTQANGHSSGPSISGNGRFIAFESDASNLAAQDTDRAIDVFVRDRQLETTTLVSASTTGGGASGQSYSARLSNDGSLVAFESTATDLVPDDTNGEADVFVRALPLGQTTRVSVAAAPLPARVNGFMAKSSVSHDGRFVAYESTATNLVLPRGFGTKIYVTDRATRVTKRVDVASDGTGAASIGSFRPSLSADGRYVVFDTDATNLAPGDTSPDTDVFRHDVVTGATTKVSDQGGVDGDISNDGRFVLYSGEFGGALTLWDGSTGTRSNIGPGGTPVTGFDPALSGDARYVAFATTSAIDPADTTFDSDIVVLDRANGVFEYASVTNAGAFGNNDSYRPAISDDGRYVVFESYATNFAPESGFSDIDIFVRDRLAGTTVCLSRPSSTLDSFAPAISPDGRYAAFGSYQVLVTPDPGFSDDHFVFDLLTGALLRVSVDALGRQQGGASWISGSGSSGLALPYVGPSIARAGAVAIFPAAASLWNVYGSYAPSENIYAARIPPSNIVISPGAPLRPGGDGRDFIGQSVASSSEYLVVAAPNGGPGADGPGEVYVYSRSDAAIGSRALAKGASAPVAVLRDGSGMIGDKFGRSVAISPDGSTIVIGVPGRGSGRAYVFTKPQAGEWTTDSTPDQTLLPQPGANDVVQEFGASVSYGGDDLVLVGAPKSDIGGATDAGLAFGYKSNSVSRLAPAAPSPGAEFGTDIDQSGNDVVIGAPGGGAGAIHVYEATTGGTLPIGMVSHTTGQIGDKFGQSVAIENGVIVVGAPGRNDGDGGATVLEKPSAGVLPFEVAELALDIDGNKSGAGSSVRIDGGLVLVGAPLADVNGNADQGRVYLYEGPDEGFAGTVDPDAGIAMLGGAPNDQFGADVDASHGDVFVGIPLRDIEDTTTQRSSAKALLVDQGTVLPFQLDRLFRSGFE